MEDRKRSKHFEMHFSLFPKSPGRFETLSERSQRRATRISEYFAKQAEMRCSRNFSMNRCLRSSHRLPRPSERFRDGLAARRGEDAARVRDVLRAREERVRAQHAAVAVS